MRLRTQDEPPPNGGFCFYHTTPSGDTVKVAGANGIRDLEKLVRSSLRANEMPIPDDLATIIEHQICVRQSNPKSVCWSGGIGDDLAEKWIDPFLVKASSGLAAIGMKALGSVVAALGSCSSCKGTKVFKGDGKDTGRAGKLNNLGKAFKNIGKKI